MSKPLHASSQAAQEMQAQAEEAAEAAAADVAAVRQQHAEAAAELAELVGERERWQADWQQERATVEAERAALLASLEVRRHPAVSLPLGRTGCSAWHASRQPLQASPGKHDPLARSPGRCCSGGW